MIGAIIGDIAGSKYEFAPNNDYNLDLFGPVALAIIARSNSFEDAIRRAVSLGADADTLGAIVGSIAEAAWGIPAEIRDKALGMLPKPFLVVLDKFSKKFDYVY